MKTKNGKREITFLGFVITLSLLVLFVLCAIVLCVIGGQKRILDSFQNLYYLSGLCLIGLVYLVVFIKKKLLLDRIMAFFSKIR